MEVRLSPSFLKCTLTRSLTYGLNAPYFLGRFVPLAQTGTRVTVAENTHAAFILSPELFGLLSDGLLVTSSFSVFSQIHNNQLNY